MGGGVEADNTGPCRSELGLFASPLSNTKIRGWAQMERMRMWLMVKRVTSCCVKNGLLVGEEVY